VSKQHALGTQRGGFYRGGGVQQKPENPTGRGQGLEGNKRSGAKVEEKGEGPGGGTRDAQRGANLPTQKGGTCTGGGAGPQNGMCEGRSAQMKQSGAVGGWSILEEEGL